MRAIEKGIKWGLHFGALAPPLAEQLAGFDLDAEKVDLWQQDADAITRLGVRGVITDGEAKSAYQRLGRQIEHEINLALATLPIEGGVSDGSGKSPALGCNEVTRP